MYKKENWSDVMLTPEQDVYAVYQQLYNAMINGDLDVINHLMMDGSIFVNVNGVRQYKREWLRNIENKSIQYYSVKEENIEIHMKEKKAKLIACLVIEGENIQGHQVWPVKTKMTMVKFKNDWKISHLEAISQ